MMDIDYNLLSEEAQLAAVKDIGRAIKFIKNPSEKVQLAAVNEDGFAIKWIKNPSEDVQIVALEKAWNNRFYKAYIKDLPNKTEWFYREFNRLKLIKGPLL